MIEASGAAPSYGSASSSPIAGTEDGSRSNRRMVPLSIGPESRTSSFAEPSRNDAGRGAEGWVEPTVAIPRLDHRHGSSPPGLSRGTLRLLFGLMGTGTLFPYNVIITCVDYFAALHPDATDVAGQLAASCLSALLVTTLVLLPLSTPPPSAVFAKPSGAERPEDGFDDDHDDDNDDPALGSTNTTRGGRFCRSLASALASATRRIALGYALCLVCLLLMAGLRSPSMAALNAASAAVGVADATSQSGLYVLAASYGEPSHSAAVTFGSAVSGLAVGVLRLATRGLFGSATVDGLRAGVALLFVLSAGVIVACLWALAVVLRDGRRDRVGWDGRREGVETEGALFGNVQMTTEMGNASGTANHTTVSTDAKECDDKWFRRLIRDSRFEVYLQTIRITWKPTLSAFLNFFITLSLFPGTLSSVQSFPGNGDGIRFGDWLPVVLITTFNAADCAGRGVLNVERLGIARLLLWRRDAVRRSSNRDGGSDHAMLQNLDWLVWYHSLSRVAFYPLLAICILPVAPHPIVTSDLLRCIIVFVFGFSNGFVNCAAFMASPTMVLDERRRDAASLLLLLAIYFGLTGGAYFGLVVESVLRSMGKVDGTSSG